MSNEITEHQHEVNQLIRKGRKRLEDLNSAIELKESEKAGIEDDIDILTERLKIITRSSKRKQQMFEQYDKLLAQSEDALNKLKQSSKALLAVVKKEYMNIERTAKLYHEQERDE